MHGLWDRGRCFFFLERGWVGWSLTCVLIMGCGGGGGGGGGD